MNRPPAWALVGIAALLLLNGVHAATIQGTIYDGLTLDVLNNVVVSVNTNPTQTKLVKEGMYSFELGPGKYTLKATYSEQGVILLETSQTITVDTDGNYTLDLILLPAVDDIPDEPLPDENDTIWTQIIQNGWGLVLLAIVLVSVGYVVIQGRKNTTLKEPALTGIESIPELHAHSTEKKEGEIQLDQYAREIIGHLKRGGNRLTQKELREKVNIGEAKVSLVVSELESYALIKKIKRGRGNILILTEKGREYLEKNGSPHPNEQHTMNGEKKIEDSVTHPWNALESPDNETKNE